MSTRSGTTHVAPVRGAPEPAQELRVNFRDERGQRWCWTRTAPREVVQAAAERAAAELEAQDGVPVTFEIRGGDDGAR